MFGRIFCQLNCHPGWVGAPPSTRSPWPGWAETCSRYPWRAWAGLWRQTWQRAATMTKDLDRYLESSQQPRGRDEYAEYDPTILVVPALKNLLRRIEENE